MAGVHRLKRTSWRVGCANSPAAARCFREAPVQPAAYSPRRLPAGVNVAAPHVACASSLHSPAPLGLPGPSLARGTVVTVRHVERFAGWFIVALALALRLGGLDRKSVWFDEALGAETALLPIPQLLTTVGAERNPPLYFVLQHFWIPFQHSDWWLRLPAAIAGTAAVGVALVFASDVLGRAPGTLAGLLVAVSPMAIDLSQEARPYGLLFLCASASLLCLERGLGARQRRWWVGYALTTVAALYAHNYAVLLVIAEVVFVAVWMARERKLDWSAIGALGASTVLFVPWLAHLASQMALVQGGFWIERPTSGVFWDIYQGFLLYTPLDHGDGSNVFLKLERWLVLGLLGLAAVPSLRSRLVQLPALTVLVPVVLALSVSVLVVPIFVLRYVSFALGAFWTVVVAGLYVLPWRSVRLALAVVVVAGVAVNLVALYADPYYSRSDLRAAAALIESRWQPGDLLIHTSEFSAVPFDYYTAGRVEQVLLGAEDDVALREARASRKRVWIVRDFGLLDPREAEQAALPLPGVEAGQRFDFPGVFVFLAS
jgi:mannosyltransferase